MKESKQTWLRDDNGHFAFLTMEKLEHLVEGENLLRHEFGDAGLLLAQIEAEAALTAKPELPAT